jgi:hypothetical protein
VIYERCDYARQSKSVTCTNAATQLPVCSLKHHHTLKRRLTPAETHWPASLAAPLLRAVVFIGREDFSTRAVAQVLFAA